MFSVGVFWTLFSKTIKTMNHNECELNECLLVCLCKIFHN